MSSRSFLAGQRLRRAGCCASTLGFGRSHIASAISRLRVNQTVGGHFRRLDRRHRRRDGALPDGMRRLESAKFLTKRAQRARPARWPYQLIEARLEGGETSETGATIVAVVERKDRSVADLGLTLAEGRALLAEVKSLLVSQQTAGWMESQLACDRCGSMLAHKDARSIVLRTVFGKVDVPSPRLWACSCAAKQGQPRRSVSPLCKAVHQRVTPELEYLQAKWAAHLPYRQATELLREVLPLDKGISLGSTRRRALAVGQALDAEIERDIASGAKPVGGDQVCESSGVGCVSVDSAWLSFSS